MGVWVYIGDPQLLGSRADLAFDQQYLEERMNESTLTLAADFDPREMPVESA